MESITNLPSDIFEKIFKNFEQRDLFLCQKVCKAWYRPFHILFLTEITLWDVYDVINFMKSIDANPDPAYISRVKSLKFYGEGRIQRKDQEYLYHLFDKQDTFHRLFFRFRNLEQVTFQGDLWIVCKITDALAQKFVTSCPKLKSFAIYHPFTDYEDADPLMHTDYYTSLYRVRPLLTCMDVRHLTNDVEGNINYSIGYVAQFPRLKEMEHVSECFTNLGEWIKILDYLPSYPSVFLTREGQKGLAESYLAGLTKPKQEKLLQTLSKLPYLRMDGMLENSIPFAMKYFRGLKSFRSSSDFTYRHNDRRIQQYMNNIFDLAATIKLSSNIAINGLDHALLSNYLPTMMEKVFYNVQESSTNYFYLFIKDRSSPKPDSTFVSTQLLKKRNRRLVNIALQNGTTVNDAAATFFYSQLNNVTVFELEMEDREERGTTSLEIYDKMLRRMPSLERLVVDIPTSFKGADLPTTEYCLPKVKDVTIRANADMELDSLFNRFYHIFPNIKQLSIYYHSGTWNPDTTEFDLDLKNYSLEQLIIDLSPIKNKYLTSHIPLEESFFVVNLKSGDKNQMYKVACNFSSVEEINEGDLVRDVDYYTMNITIHKLNRLQLFINYEKYYHEDKPTYKNIKSNGKKKDSKTLIVRLNDEEYIPVANGDTLRTG